MIGSDFNNVMKKYSISIEGIYQKVNKKDVHVHYIQRNDRNTLSNTHSSIG